MTLAQSPPAQWTKLEKIRYLLDMWDAIFDPNATSQLGTPGDGSGVALLPLMASHQSVVELNRCLTLLAGFAPTQYQHLKCYHTAETRIRTDRVRRRRPNSSKFEIVEVRRRDKVYPRWVKLEKVRRGEQFLADRFQGEVFIPGELWDALNTPAVAA